MKHCIEFLQRLIQTQSLPGEEEALSEVVLDEMRALGFDHAERDEIGNVIGLWRGARSDKNVMLNTHLDHVDVGDPDRWPYPPFGAEVHEGRLWGRGAVDIKGPLAAQVYAIGSLVRENQRPPYDVYVTVTTMEEVGGPGAIYLAENLDVNYAVVGEPSSNQLRRGHRGRTEVQAHVKGRSAHASAPNRGINPLKILSHFMVGLDSLRMNTDAELGVSTVTPTILRTDQTSPNVIPSEAWLTCDWRNVPGEEADQIQEKMQDLLDDCMVDGASGEVQIPLTERVTYTGYRARVSSCHPAFVLGSEDPALLAAISSLSTSVGPREVPGIWKFATDGGHFARAGIVVIGFGPGDERLAHTVDESISLSELEEGIHAYQALAMKWLPEIE